MAIARMPSAAAQGVKVMMPAAVHNTPRKHNTKNTMSPGVRCRPFETSFMPGSCIFRRDRAQTKIAVRRRPWHSPAAVGQQDFQKAACTSCGGKIEFPTTAQGMTVECPHCHAQTELQPVQMVGRNISRLLLFAVVGIACAIATLVFLKQKQPDITAPKVVVQTNAVVTPTETPPRPKAADDLKVTGPVSVDKAQGSRLSYAIGTLKNDSEHQRFGVKVELELFDSAGNKLPTTANDYVQTLAPREERKFRALVLEPKAATAKVISIKED